MVERSLSMREALGSMPRFSIYVFAYFVGFIFGRLIFPFTIVRSVVGLVVRISAFHADGPGSIPGRRINLFPSSAFNGNIRREDRKCMYVVPLAQWLERRSYEPDVAGSNPAWNIFVFSKAGIHLVTR